MELATQIRLMPPLYLLVPHVRVVALDALREHLRKVGSHFWRKLQKFLFELL